VALQESSLEKPLVNHKIILQIRNYNKLKDKFEIQALCYELKIQQAKKHMHRVNKVMILDYKNEK